MDLLISKGSVDYAIDTGGSTKVAGIWDIDTLEVGAIAAFTEDGELLYQPSDAITKRVCFVVNTVNGIRRSSLIDVNDNLSITKNAYAAPVAAVKYLGSDAAAAAGNGSLNLPTSIAVGDVYGVIVKDKTKRPHSGDTKVYSGTVVSGDVLTGTGASNIITKLVAIINADPNGIVTAVAMADGSGNNDGIRFTSDTAGEDFGLANLAGVLDTASIVERLRIDGSYDASSTTAVLTSNGSGTVAQLTEMVKMANTTIGVHNYNVDGMYLETGASEIVAAETYVLYTISYKNDARDALINSDNFTDICYLAIPSSETGADAAIDELDSIIAKL